MDWLQILSNSASSILSPATIAYALAALGLAVHFGYAGLLNMGIAGFMALGAYGYAISILTFGFPWWGGVLVGMARVGASFALILGIPTLRLRGDYLAIVTIAAAEVVRLLFLTTGVRRGHRLGRRPQRVPHELPRGEPDPRRARTASARGTYNDDDWWVRILGILALALAVLVVWRLMRSPWGRVLKGIREDEDAVRSLGKNVFPYKMQALVLGGVIAARRRHRLRAALGGRSRAST